MRCALKSDSAVIIRVVLPVVESWSWTKACSVAVSERKCCYACRSCSHLCLNQWLYIICFFLQRDFQLTPLCILSSTSLLDKVDWTQGPEAGERSQTGWASGSQKYCVWCRDNTDYNTDYFHNAGKTGPNLISLPISNRYHSFKFISFMRFQATFKCSLESDTYPMSFKAILAGKVMLYFTPIIVTFPVLYWSRQKNSRSIVNNGEKSHYRCCAWGFFKTGLPCCSELQVLVLSPQRMLACNATSSRQSFSFNKGTKSKAKSKSSFLEEKNQVNSLPRMGAVIPVYIFRHKIQIFNEVCSTLILGQVGSTPYRLRCIHVFQNYEFSLTKTVILISLTACKHTK